MKRLSKDDLIPVYEKLLELGNSHSMSALDRDKVAALKAAADIVDMYVAMDNTQEAASNETTTEHDLQKILKKVKLNRNVLDS